MCNAPFTGTPLSHRVYSERAGLSLEHPESSGVRDNVLELCLTGIFLEWHHFLRPLQTSLHCRQGKKISNLQMIQEEQKTFPGHTGLKASGVSVALL